MKPFRSTVIANIKYFQRSFATSTVGGSDVKKKICIVGAGPAGFYAAQHLIKNLPDCYVDIVEKLPVPFGLVRFGVAPDHPEVKNVINTFNKTAENSRVNFFGNLTLGFDFTLQDLRDRYHAVILSYGAEKDRKLNIPNEYPSNVLSAREFVAWYNGLPGTENYKPNLNNSRSVAIIGQGNVAVDVSRILLSPIDALAKTDITQSALQTLSESKVEKVYIVGRRGPLQAAFTIKELREMTKLPGVNILWRSEDFIGVNECLPNLPRPRKRLTELMLSSLSTQLHEEGKKLFIPIFLRSPQRIDSANNLILSINHLVGTSAVATSATETLETDLIMRSIGYKSVCLDKDLNFDDEQGFVNNVGGRVLKKRLTGSDNSIDDIEDKFERGLYVTGWLATGPTGVILTTMNNSFSVAHAVCEDFKTGAIRSKSVKPGLEDLLANKIVVTWEGWNRIDKNEIEAGKLNQKPREKIVNVKKMLELIS